MILGPWGILTELWPGERRDNGVVNLVEDRSANPSGPPVALLRFLAKRRGTLRGHIIVCFVSDSTGSNDGCCYFEKDQGCFCKIDSRGLYPSELPFKSQGISNDFKLLQICHEMISPCIKKQMESSVEIDSLKITLAK